MSVCEIGVVPESLLGVNPYLDIPVSGLEV